MKWGFFLIIIKLYNYFEQNVLLLVQRWRAWKPWIWRWRRGGSNVGPTNCPTSRIRGAWCDGRDPIAPTYGYSRLVRRNDVLAPALLLDNIETVLSADQIPNIWFQKIKKSKYFKYKWINYIREYEKIIFIVKKIRINKLHLFKFDVLISNKYLLFVFKC